MNYSEFGDVSLLHRNVTVTRKLKIYGLNEKPTGEIIEKGERGVVSGYVHPDDPKWDVRLEGFRCFSIPKKWLKKA